tara:strand:+ start:1113 stop:1625 length:513 start_codon:yes stop_codon:yes gene_type:complete
MKNKGIVFWIEGYSGSGKTTISRKIKEKIELKYGTSILINGDDIRKIFKLDDYSKIGRYKVFKKYLSLTKLIIKQNINVIFTVVGLNKKYHQLLKKNFKNLITILIQSDIKKIKKLGLKKTYGHKKNIIGIHIKPNLPKYQIIIKNDFKKSLNILSSNLIGKIEKKLIHK